MEVGEIIKHPPERTHEHTHTHIHTPVMSAPEHPLHYTVKLFRNENIRAFFLSFFLHVTFNTALPLHMEASSKLVIAGYVEVKSLIRAMCSEHYVYIFHVSPRGNQCLRWPTHVLSKIRGEYIYELTVHSCGTRKHEGQHLPMHEKYCSITCNTETLKKHAWGCSTIKLCFWCTLREVASLSSIIYHISVSHEHSDLYCRILLIKTKFFFILSSRDLMTFVI